MASRRDESYYFSFVTFQVEETLFRVPRKEFEEQSDVFKDMFAMPLGVDSEADGQSDEKPLRLDGIAVDDFRTFLKALYPRFTIHNTPLTEKELETALVLAKMWYFDKLQGVLIDRLASLNLMPARKLELARIHDIRQWYKPELGNMARRLNSLTMEEVKQIGMDLAFMVFSLRDKRLEVIMKGGVGRATNYSPRYTGAEIEEHNKEKLKEAFDTILSDLAQAHHWDG